MRGGREGGREGKTRKGRWSESGREEGRDKERVVNKGRGRREKVGKDDLT